MIVEPRHLFPGRTESSGPEPASPSQRNGDDAFDRALSNALRSDRADRPTDRNRRRPGPDDERAPRTTARRDDRRETAADRGDQRIGDDEPAGTAEKVSEREPAEGGTGENRSAADVDRSTGADPTRRPVDADAIDRRVAGHAETMEVAVAAALTAASEDGAVDPAAAEGATGLVTAAAPVLATGSAESGSVAIGPDLTAATPAAGPGDRLPAELDGAVEGATELTPTAPIVDGGAGGNDLNGADHPVGAGDPAATAGRIDRPASNVRPAIVPIESTDDVEEAGDSGGGAATDGSVAGKATVADAAVATAGAAAMADQRPSSAPDADSTDVSTDSSTSTEVSDAASVAPLGQRTTSGDPESETDPATGNPSPSLDASDLVDTTEAPEAGSDETVVQPTRLGNDRTPSGLSPVASARTPASAPIRSMPAAVETSNPAPELVELQTTGLAERLRPALAAVRRGVNGLDELRLRIQDDNAGPIKVDIATIDNRVRVLLSAGSDDLMRQLGQERDRLADELRRAGFDQASIDIEANDPGRRHGRYDREAPDRSGSGAADPGLAGEPTATAIERAASQRDRGLTGLDLDL